jgi:hypothetical protein
MSGDWINFDSRQHTTGAVFPPVDLPITPACLNEPKYNLEGPIGFGVLALCISSRLMAACIRAGLIRDVLPAVVASMRDKQSDCLDN